MKLTINETSKIENITQYEHRIAGTFESTSDVNIMIKINNLEYYGVVIDKDTNSFYAIVYLYDGNNDISVIASNKSGETVSNSFSINVNILAGDIGMPQLLTNFVDDTNNDIENIKVKIGSAELSYYDPKAGKNKKLYVDTNVISHYFELEGFNSDLYRLDASQGTMPFESTIVQRPLIINFDAIEKEYDGTKDITSGYESFDLRNGYTYIDPINTTGNFLSTGQLENDVTTKSYQSKEIYDSNGTIEESFTFTDDNVDDDIVVDFSTIKLNVDGNIGYCDSEGNIRFIVDSKLTGQYEAEKIIANNYPKGLYYFIAESIRSAIPILNDVSVEDTSISGTSVIGSIIRVTFPNGLITTTKVSQDASWFVSVPQNVKLKPYTKDPLNVIKVEQIEEGKIVSPTTIRRINEVETILQSKAPIVNNIYERNTTITGKGVAYSTISILINGTDYYKTTVDSNEKWICNLRNPINENDYVVVNQTEVNHSVSPDVEFTITKLEFLPYPIIYPVTESSEYVFGTGTPGAIVHLRIDGNNEQDIKVYYNGQWKYYVGNMTLVDGMTIEASQAAPDKNESPLYSIKVTGEDITTTPVINPIKAGDTTITGTGIPGAEIILSNSDNENLILRNEIISEPETQLDHPIILVNANNAWITGIYTTYDNSIPTVEILTQLTNTNVKIYALDYSLSNIQNQTIKIKYTTIENSVQKTKIETYNTGEDGYISISNFNSIGNPANYKKYLGVITTNDTIIDIKYLDPVNTNFEIELPEQYTLTDYVYEIYMRNNINKSVTNGYNVVLFENNNRDNTITKRLIDSYVKLSKRIIVDNNGNWSYTPDIELRDGFKVFATQKEDNRIESYQYVVEVKLDNEDQSNQISINPIYEGDKIISGKQLNIATNQDHYIYIKFNNNKEYKVKLSNRSDWYYTIPDTIDLIEGEQITITANENHDSESHDIITTINRSNKIRSTIPNINLVQQHNTTIHGSLLDKTDNELSVVEVFINNNSIGTVQTRTNAWSINIPSDIKLNIGDAVSVIHREYNKIASKEVSTTVARNNIADSPSINSIKEDDTIISGFGYKSNNSYTARINLSINNNEYTTTTDSNGIWSIKLHEEDIPTSNIEITATQTVYYTNDINREYLSESAITTTHVKLLPPLEVFTIDPFYGEDNKLSGTGIANSSISIYFNDIKIHESDIIVNSSGKWSYNLKTIDIKTDTETNEDTIVIGATSATITQIATNLNITELNFKFVEYKENYKKNIITITNYKNEIVKEAEIILDDPNLINTRFTYLYDNFTDPDISNTNWSIRQSLSSEYKNLYEIKNGGMYYGPPKLPNITIGHNLLSPTNLNNTNPNLRYRIQLSTKRNGDLQPLYTNKLPDSNDYITIRLHREAMPMDYEYNPHGLSQEGLEEALRNWKGTWESFLAEYLPKVKMVYNDEGISFLTDYVLKTGDRDILCDKDNPVTIKVTDTNNNKPVTGLDIRVINSTNTLVGQGFTNSNGKIVIPNNDILKNYETLNSIYLDSYIGSLIARPTNSIFNDFTIEANVKFKWNEQGVLNGSLDGYFFIGIVSEKTDLVESFKFNVGNKSNIRASRGTIGYKIGSYEFDENKIYNIKIVYESTNATVYVNNKLIGNYRGLLTEEKRRVVLGHNTLAEITWDNVNIYSHNTKMQNASWRLDLSDDFQKKNMLHVGPLDNTTGDKETQLYYSWIVSQPFDDNNWTLINTTTDKHELNWAALRYNETEPCKASQFKLEFSFSIQSFNDEDNSFNLGLFEYKVAKGQQGKGKNKIIEFRTNRIRGLDDNEISFTFVPRTQYDCQIICLDRLYVFLKRRSDLYYQYIGSSSIDSFEKQIVFGYYHTKVTVDNIKYYINSLLPTSKTNNNGTDNKEEANDIIYPDVPILSKAIIEGDTIISGTGDKGATINLSVKTDHYVAEVNNNGKWSITLDDPIEGGEEITIYETNESGDSLLLNTIAGFKENSKPLSICGLHANDTELIGYIHEDNTTNYSEIKVSITNNGSYRVILDDQANNEINGKTKWRKWNIPISTNKIKLRSGYEVRVTGIERIGNEKTKTNNTASQDVIDETLPENYSSVIIAESNMSALPLVHTLVEDDNIISGFTDYHIDSTINITRYSDDDPISYTTSTSGTDTWMISTTTIDDDDNELSNLLIKDEVVSIIRTDKDLTPAPELNIGVRPIVRATPLIIQPIIGESKTIDDGFTGITEITIDMPTSNNQLSVELETDGVYEYIESGIVQARTYTIESQDPISAGSNIIAEYKQLDFNKLPVTDTSYPVSTYVIERDQLSIPTINPIIEDDLTITGTGIPYNNISVKVAKLSDESIVEEKTTNVDSNGNWSISLNSDYIDENYFVLVYQYNTNHEKCNSNIVRTGVKKLFMINQLTVNSITNKDGYVTGTGLAGATITITRVRNGSSRTFATVKVKTDGTWKSNNISLEVNDKIIVEHTKEGIDGIDTIELYVTFANGQIIALNTTGNTYSYKEVDSIAEAEKWLLDNNQLSWNATINQQSPNYVITFNKSMQGYQVQHNVIVTYRYDNDNNDDLIVIPSEMQDIQVALSSINNSSFKAIFANKNVTEQFVPVYLQNLKLIDRNGIVDGPYSNYQIANYVALGRINKRPIDVEMFINSKIYDGSNKAPIDFIKSRVIDPITGDDISIDSNQTYINYVNENTESNKQFSDVNVILTGEDSNNYYLRNITYNNNSQRDITIRDCELVIHELRYNTTTKQWDVSYTITNKVDKDDVSIIYNVPNYFTVKARQLVNESKLTDTNYNNSSYTGDEVDVISTFFSYTKPDEIIRYDDTGRNTQIITVNDKTDERAIYAKSDVSQSIVNQEYKNIEISKADNQVGYIQLNQTNIPYYQNSDKSLKLYNGQYVHITDFKLNDSTNYNLTTKEIYCKITIV